MDEWIPPPVSPPDQDGFRTFSIDVRGVGEALRVSFNLDRLRDWLANTAFEESVYTREEQERVKLAARIAAARDAFPGHKEEQALAIILQDSPDKIAKSLEIYFPSFALLALEAATDVCVKRGLNRAVQSAGAPRMYDDRMIRLILSDFESTATKFLQITPGRPVETEKHLSETKQALDQLERKRKIQRGKKLPTQELVSSELGITSRALRDWCKTCKLTWREFLRACGWPVKRKEIQNE